MKIITIILILIITGDAMGGPQYKKKLDKKWKPIVLEEPVYTEPVNKSIQFKGIKVGGVYGKEPNFNIFKKLFKN